MNPTEKQINIKRGVIDPKRAVDAALTHIASYSEHPKMLFKPTDEMRKKGDNQTLSSEMKKNNQVYVGAEE